MTSPSLRLAALLVVSLAAPASAGWKLEIVTRTIGGPGPSSKVTLLVEDGKIRESHEDGQLYLWNVPKGTMFRLDPAAKTYSGGPVEEMARSVEAYLAELQKKSEALSPEDREQLEAEGVPIPEKAPEVETPWSVRETDRTETIAGHEARLYEVYQGGLLFEERWVASGLTLGDDLDVSAYERLRHALEAAFARGMGKPYPKGDDVESLLAKGFPVKSAYVAAQLDVVRELTKLEELAIPAATFEMPEGFRQK